MSYTRGCLRCRSHRITAKKNIEGKIEKLLSNPSMLSAAAQYYVRFPGHFFKVVHTLNDVIGANVLSGWLDRSPRICVVDVGCGAGSATAALINCVLKLQKIEALTRPIEISCFGIDVNPFAIALYDRMISLISSKIDSQKLLLDYRLIPYGDSDARIQLEEMLNEKRQNWGQPFLPQVFLMQVNVVSPFSKRHEDVRKRYEELANLGISTSGFGSYHQTFGMQEATTYKQLLEEVAIDRLHVVTIGTEGYEARVQEMASAINKAFDAEKHNAQKLGQGKHFVSYHLPRSSYWREQQKSIIHFSEFEVDVTSILSARLEDGEWAAVIDSDNLQLAWARARHHLLDESLADEVEIRLFEANLDGNLEKLRQHLIAYAAEIIQPDDRLYYRFPKSQDKTRPRGLSRIEEEVLSTALIQKLGAKLSNMTHTSFANKFSQPRNGGENEYLYENWYKAHTLFINHACAAARELGSRLVIRLDIKSFYTRIIRDQLTEIAAEQLTKSKRIEWLIRLLLSKNIDEHEAGLGIVQGNLSSGFFANLYLLDLDDRFPVNNQWEARFFRYVDDMIIVLPDPASYEEIIEVIQAELKKRGLELNDEKTELFSPQDFLNDCAPDEEIEKLRTQNEKLIQPLWILDESGRKTLRSHYNNSNDQWWDSISTYCFCLQSLGLFFKETILSRRIFPYLFNPKRRADTLNGESELKFPIAPDEASPRSLNNWAIAFLSANQNWHAGLGQLRTELECLFFQSFDSLDSGGLAKNQERKLIRRVRWSVNRLSEIGYGQQVVAKLMEVLCKSPWLFRDITEVVESLAQQEFTEVIKSLLAFHSQAQDEMAEYMKAITLRAARFLKQVDDVLWDEIARSAVSASVVNCLLATETWLSVGYRCSHLIKPSQLDEVEVAFRSSTSSRLRKNYLLILVKFRGLPQDSLDLSGDSILKQAFDIAVTGEIDSLFDYQEPEVIKSKYYSGVQSYEEDDGFSLPS